MNSKKNIRDQVTVFLISVDDGTASLGHCEKALFEQNTIADLVHIHNIAPMNAAFQRMTDLCETPFFVQVDHDMILYPDAVERLVKGIQATDEKIALYSLPLWDVHLQKTIVGVKIYRTEIMKKYPYQTSFSCEVDQMERMKKDGYGVEVVWKSFEKSDLCVGEHGSYYTPQTIFIRYKRLMEKSRLFPWIEWVKALPVEFAERFRTNPDDLNYFAHVGALAGLTSPIESCRGEYDFTSPDPAFQRLWDLQHPPQIEEINLYVTARCNFQCSFCRRQEKSDADFPDMNVGNLKMFLDLVSNATGATIAGFGEPLLVAELPVLIRTIKKRDLFVGLITNGALLESRLDDLRGLGLDSLSISLNAADAAEHRAINGTETFKAVLHGIESAVKQKVASSIRVSFVVTRQNFERIPSYVALAHGLGVENVDLLNLLPHRASTYDDAEFWESVLQIEDSEISDQLEKWKADSAFASVKNWPILISRDENPLRCDSPFKSVGFNSAGFYGGCRRVLPPCSEYGGYFKNPNFWNEKYHSELRAQLRGDRPLRDVCRMCFGNWRKP